MSRSYLDQVREGLARVRELYKPAWTACPEPTCRGAVHRRGVVDSGGEVEWVGYCSSCGLPTG